MFEFLSMFNDYEQRKVDNYTNGDIQVDTVAVNDSEHPFETGITHPRYKDGEWIIVETYDTKKDAQVGHLRWVKIMTDGNLPRTLRDTSTAGVKRFWEALGVFPEHDVYEIKKAGNI